MEDSDNFKEKFQWICAINFGEKVYSAELLFMTHFQVHLALTIVMTKLELERDSTGFGSRI